MKFNKIFSVLASAALLTGVYACTDHVEPTPSPVAGNDEVYFPTTESEEITVPKDAKEISLIICRVDATEETTVGLTSRVYVVEEVEGDEEEEPDDAIPPVEIDVTDVFDVPASVTFPKGAKQVSLVIPVDFEKVEIDRSYYIDLKLEDSYTGAYGLSHKVFAATYLPWTEWELMSEVDYGIYQQGALWDYEYPTPVYTRESLIQEGKMQYLVFSPFSDFEYEEIIELDPTKTIEVDGVKCPRVRLVEPINTPIMNSNYGQYYSYTTIFEYLKEVSGFDFADDEDILSYMEYQGWELSYYNPVQGRFYLNMMLYINDGYFGPGLETLQLPGEFSDYYFTFAYDGNFVSDEYDPKEYAVVEVVPSADMDHFLCQLIPGQLNEKELEAAYTALDGDEEAEYIYAGSYKINYAFPENGKYTVIAVGYDKENKLVAKGSKTFTFETKQLDKKWNTLGYVDYTDGIFVGLILKASQIVTWEVLAQESIQEPGLYRLCDPYGSWPYLDYVGWEMVDGKHYLYVDARDPKGVLLPLSELGIDVDVVIDDDGNTMGSASVMSEAWYQIEYRNSTLTAQKRAGNCGTFENNRITFPAGRLLLMADDEDGTAFYTNLDPSRPTGKPVTWGRGYFDIDFSPLADASAASAKKVKRNVEGLSSVATLKQLVEQKNANIKMKKTRCGHALTQEQVRDMMTKKALRK